MSTARSKKLSILACAMLHGLNHALQVMLPPLYLAIRDDLGLGQLRQTMLLGTAYLVTYAVMSVPYGFLGDRVSKKKLLVAGAVLNSIALFVVAGSGSYPIMIVGMILAGLGGGAYHPAAMALISNLFKDMMGRAFGLIGMGASLGFFLGPAASGFLGELFGWRAACIIFGIFGCIVAALFALVLPEEHPMPPEHKEAAFSLRVFVFALLPIVGVAGMRDFCLWGATYLTPAMTQMDFGFSMKEAGIIAGIMNLAGILSQPLLGTLSDRLGRARMLKGTLAVAAISVASFPFVGGISLYALAFLFGFMVLGTVPALDAAAAETVPPRFRSRMYGMIITISFMLGALSPFIMGLIHDSTGTYRIPYIVLGISALAGGGLVFTIRGKAVTAS